MTDKEYVQANWDTIWTEHIASCLCLQIGPDQQFAIARKVEAEAWSAAAEFTRERLEQIRQLEKDIAETTDWFGYYHKHLVAQMQYCEDDLQLARNNTGCLCVHARILARLESALADLKRGMRTAAPDGARSDAND